MDEEQKFKFRIFINKFKVFVLYLLKEPFYESKSLFKGYYNSTLIFWIAVMGFVILKINHIGGWKINLSIAIALVAYIKMFWDSNKWKEYYQKENIDGKTIEDKPEL